MKKFTLLAFVLLVGCKTTLTPAQVVTDIIDVVDAACTLAETQPDPSWVYYVCSVADTTGTTIGTVATQYTTRVPVADSAAFEASKHITRKK